MQMRYNWNARLSRELSKLFRCWERSMFQLVLFVSQLTNSGCDEHDMFAVEHVRRGTTIRTIDPDTLHTLNYQGENIISWTPIDRWRRRLCWSWRDLVGCIRSLALAIKVVVDFLRPVLILSDVNAQRFLVFRTAWNRERMPFKAG